METRIVIMAMYTVLLVVFAASLVWAIRGERHARYLLGLWAIAILLALPFANHANAVLLLPVGLLSILVLYALVVVALRTNVQLKVAHEETRRVLAESNRRIDDERRAISRLLHDEVNPNLVLCKHELNRLKPYLEENEKACKILASVENLIGEAYKQLRAIIKSTRIEVIDSIGFTAAIESLISHFTTFFDKPAIVLHHNLPARADVDAEVAVIAYKILREAIYNAIKHANARQITVSLTRKEEQHVVHVVVTDDGVGTKARVNAHGGMESGIGLIDMRERARLIDGNLKIQPAFPLNHKRPGTKVSFSFSTRSS